MLFRSPTILQSPPTRVLAQKAAASLWVRASGTGPLSYQWSLNGVDLANETNVTLTLNSATPADAGTYTVRVSNDLGSAQSDPALVTVLSSPLLSIDQAGSDMIVAFPAAPGFLYNVEWAPMPLGNSWSAAGTALTDPVGVIWLTNSLSVEDARFFRIRKP